MSMSKMLFHDVRIIIKDEFAKELESLGAGYDIEDAPADKGNYGSAFIFSKNDLGYIQFSLAKSNIKKLSEYGVGATPEQMTTPKKRKAKSNKAKKAD